MAKKVTEFELMQALWDCSTYVRDLPTKEETRAIKEHTSILLHDWLDQQNLSDKEHSALAARVTRSGPLVQAAQSARKEKHQRDLDEISNN